MLSIAHHHQFFISICENGYVGKQVFSDGLIKNLYCGSNHLQKYTKNGVAMVCYTKTTNYRFSAHEHSYYCPFSHESLPWPDNNHKYPYLLHCLRNEGDAVQKLGRRWGLLNGNLKKRREDQLFILRWEIGSKLANLTTWYIKAKLDGLTSGQLSKLPWAAVAKSNTDKRIMRLLIVKMKGLCEGVGVGWRAYLINNQSHNSYHEKTLPYRVCLKNEVF